MRLFSLTFELATINRCFFSFSPSAGEEEDIVGFIAL